MRNIKFKSLAVSFLIILFLSFAQNSSAQVGQDIQPDQETMQSESEESPHADFDDEFQDFNFDKTAIAEVYDPFESVNRKIFVFNDKVDIYFMEPVARFYGKVTPDPVVKSVRNFLTNLGTPFTVANSLLQGDGANAMSSFSAFLINSTLGVGGLFDVAGHKKIEYTKEDLGQTLARYGSGPGPYLVLPFFGPSNIRDASGFAVTEALSPLSLNVLDTGDDEVLHDKALISLSVISAIDKRESLLTIVEDLRKNSFDFYASSRSAYMQNRESKLKH